QQAKEQKIVKYVGISGHNDPEVLKTAMERFPFDMVLIPLNPTEPHHPRAFTGEFLEYARRKGVAIAVMKVMGVGRLVGEGKFTVSELFRYALSFPIHTAVILPNSLRELRELLQAAHEFKPISSSERAGQAAYSAGCRNVSPVALTLSRTHRKYLPASRASCDACACGNHRSSNRRHHHSAARGVAVRGDRAQAAAQAREEQGDRRLASPTHAAQ
ncbi:MAG: hypothetical protein NZ520_11960, partial [bacterium]|nr:hypothetical protein [bacterium]